MKQALGLYDHEASYDEQSPEVLSQLEVLFGLEDFDWPSEHLHATTVIF